MKISVSKIRSWLHGKGASYLLNAYVDAIIEQELLYYVKNKKIKSKDSEIITRVKDILKSTRKDNFNTRILIKAFAYKYANGYTDYWYSKIFYKLSGVKFPQENNYYLDFKGLKFSPIIHTLKLLFFYSVLAEYYLNNLGKSDLLPRKEIKKEIMNVQKLNISENKNTITKINQVDKSAWKVKKIFEWSNKDKHPEIFIRSVIDTQLSAGKWDKLYSLAMI